MDFFPWPLSTIAPTKTQSSGVAPVEERPRFGTHPQPASPRHWRFDFALRYAQTPIRAPCRSAGRLTAGVCLSLGSKTHHLIFDSALRPETQCRMKVAHTRGNCVEGRDLRPDRKEGIKGVSYKWLASPHRTVRGLPAAEMLSTPVPGLRDWIRWVRLETFGILNV